MIFQFGTSGWYIKEKIWHESQKFEPQEDGSLLFEAVVAGTEEVKYWVLSWGANARVLEPESLKEEISAQAAATLALYSQGLSPKQAVGPSL